MIIKSSSEIRKIKIEKVGTNVPIYKSKKNRRESRKKFLWFLLWLFGMASTIRAVWMNYTQYSQFLSVVNQKSYDFHSSKEISEILLSYGLH